LRRSADVRRRGRVTADFRRFDAAQGYYFSKPLPAEAFARLLAEWNPRTHEVAVA
jgi:hypothetical protein